MGNWVKSSYSMGNENCIEIAYTHNVILVRDSEDPYTTILNFTPDTWVRFTEIIKSA